MRNGCFPFLIRYTSVMKDFLTTQEAAEILGVTARRVVAMIQAKQLPAQLVGSNALYLIAREDLKLVKIRKPGRPKKGKS